MTVLRVAAVQASYVLMDRDATIGRVAELTAAAAREGAQLVVFPEVFVPGTPVWIDTQPIWDGDEDWFALLAQNAVVDAGQARIGGLICWENYMPLARFHLYAQGVDLWIAPTLAVGDGWIATMRHLARENRMFVVAGTPSCTPTRYQQASPRATACSPPATSKRTVPGWKRATPSSWHRTARCWPARSASARKP